MDPKIILGRAIRALRETGGLSQEKLSEKANITYQYLSAVENGKENFTVGVLDAIATALSTDFENIVAAAYHLDDHPRVDPKYFVEGAPRPPGLTVAEIEAALNETHRIIRLVNTTLMKIAGRPLAGFIQRNNLSGIISNILCDSFSRLTSYKHNHHQRYPDLIFSRMEGGKTSEVGLEVKSTIRPGKGGESHNGHSGWHIVACFDLEPVRGDIRFIHIMFADLIGHGKKNADWAYVDSKVNADTGSQRTETYTTNPKGTAKLRHGTVYLDTSRIEIKRWRTFLDMVPPKFSPFQFRVAKARVVRKKRK